MDWAEFSAARQLLAEERVGTRVREQAAREDAAFKQAQQGISSIERRHSR